MSQFKDYHNIHILIVDDLPNMVSNVRKILKNLGFNNFHFARDGEEAMRVLDKFQVDFVISDWQMPKVCGMKLVEFLRSEKRFLNLPFILMSDLISEKRVLQAGESGIDGIICKPFSPQQFEEKILSVLKRKHKLNRFDTLILEAKEAIFDENYKRAKERCLKALEINEYSAQVNEILGKASMKLKEIEDAESYLQEAITINDGYLRPYDTIGDLYISLGKMQEGMRYYLKASERSPYNKNRQFNIGKQYLQMKRIDKAKVAFKIACDVYENKDQNILNEIGEIYTGAGYIKEAQEVLDEAMRIDDNNIDSINRMAIVKRRSGQFQDALELYHRALALDDYNENLHFNTAVVYFMLGKKSNSMEHLERALQINPDFSEANQMMQKVKGVKK